MVVFCSMAAEWIFGQDGHYDRDSCTRSRSWQRRVSRDSWAGPRYLQLLDPTGASDQLQSESDQSNASSRAVCSMIPFKESQSLRRCAVRGCSSKLPSFALSVPLARFWT